MVKSLKIVIVLLVFFLCSCYEKDVTGENVILLPTIQTDSIESDVGYGTTSGNINNYGLVATDGESIVYANSTDNGGLSDTKLYKMDMQGNNLVKLSDDRARYVNLVENWVFYSNLSDNRKAYRIKLDGSQREKLNDDLSDGLYVVGDWAYYIGRSSTLFKMKTDGSFLTELYNDVGRYYCVNDNWIYFQKSELITDTAANSNRYCNFLHRMKIDGSDPEKIYDKPIFEFIISENMIFFCSDNEQHIYQMSINGQEIRRINDDASAYINIHDGWLYYCNFDDYERMYRIRIDGSQKEMVSDDRCFAINIVGDWIFYDMVFAEHCEQFKMRLDGSDKHLVENDRSDDI